MSKKERTDLDDFDFGFTMLDSSEMTQKEEVDSWYAKAHDVHDMVNVFLNKLLADQKDMIHWPYDKRKEAIENFKNKMLDILAE